MGKITVKIREVATGKEVDFDTEMEEKYLDSLGFYYQEGNGSCDCNRKLMFGQAQGINFSDEETPCSFTQYIVQVFVDGKICLDEFPNEPDVIDWGGGMTLSEHASLRDKS
jgi:hypothetical protein